jgi:D-beta-D-heptose 7-phosphate kinase/D-beta-D-heptose 1-phosphate adenosyltransferase
MVKLTRTLCRLGNAKVMVVGDFMLDNYTIGKARRISPEAPVAVVSVTRQESRPGGAGNVVLNLISLGASVVALGRVGCDAAGESIKSLLGRESVDTGGIYAQENYPTPVKNRIIADNQQIVRIDFEDAVPLSEAIEAKIIKDLPHLMQTVSTVAISDYGKGFLSKKLLKAIIDEARKREIPVITDPKGLDFSKYSGTTMIKPNLSEAYAAAGLPPETPLDAAAVKILQAANADILMVTRSEQGLSLFYRGGDRRDFPVRVREVKDVTGAGDTVLAMLTCAVANGLSMDESAQLSNIAAGIAIERFGCARVTLSDLARRLLEFDVTNKIFDEDHLFALKAALQDRNYTILSVPSDQGMTSSIFTAIHRLGQEPNSDLILFLEDADINDPFVHLLASLNTVKFIIVHEPSLVSLCESLPPKALYRVNENTFKQVATISDMIDELNVVQ